MFGFFKELVGVIKEGIAEGHETVAEADAAKRATRMAGNPAFERRLALASPEERLVAALAGPYRETFLSDLEEARELSRPPVHLFCASLPAAGLDEWRGFLHRDFDVTDARTAEATIAAMLTTIPPGQPGAAAVAICRTCHIAAGAIGLGYADAPRALAWVQPAIDLAADGFASWAEYDAAFLLGERDAPGSNVLGRKVLAGTVKRLTDDPASPWAATPWPVRA